MTTAPHPTGEAPGEVCDPARVHTSLTGHLHLELDELSQVGSARRAVTRLGRRLGLSDAAVGTAALSVTEVAKNLVLHAGGGDLLLWWTPAGAGSPAIEVTAVDRGPGLPSVERCFADGFSTAGTPGTGLGAVLRASRALDVYSRPGGGTVLWFRHGEKSLRAVEEERYEVAAAVAAHPAETVSGDGWGAVEDASGLCAAVCDGLGHGALAAGASREALRHFCDHAERELEPLLEGMHGALRDTRGCAVSAAHLDPRRGRLRYAGVGNVEGVVERPGGDRRRLVSHHGTLGVGRPRLQAFESELADDAVVVLHSDGLGTRWRLEDYPGLVDRHPGVIAGVLFRDHRRRNDDAAVLVARRGPGEGARPWAS